MDTLKAIEVVLFYCGILADYKSKADVRNAKTSNVLLQTNSVIVML